MEWAVCAASSDSEDATTQEINEEEGSPSNKDQQDSLYGAGEQLSSKDSHGSVDLTFDKEAAFTRNGSDSMDSEKAKAGKKTPDQEHQDLTHFEKQQGIKRSAPDSVGSTCTVNISEGYGMPDHDPENIAMQRMSKEEDEEQELGTQEDLGESAEELEFDSSNSTNGVSLKLNTRRSAVQRKKRNLTEDEPDQASKMVKTLEHPPKNQLPYTGCGESASDPSCSQWNESFQSKQLDENWAAEESVSCTESKEMQSPSSELVEHQEVLTGEEKYHCAKCNITCRNEARINRHRLFCNRVHKPYQCPECNKCFSAAHGLSNHRFQIHNVEYLFQCTECDLTFSTSLLRKKHHKVAHEVNVKCLECKKLFPNHRHTCTWKRFFQCTECNIVLKNESVLHRHQFIFHNIKPQFSCTDYTNAFSVDVTCDWSGIV